MRIRTIKPELWKDVRIGALSPPARLLVPGLMTMADDEGRLLATPSLVIGHCFPHDAVSPRRLAAWEREVLESGIVVAYEHGGHRYLAFKHWRARRDVADPLVAQLINRPSPSQLPAPPDPEIVRSNAVSGGVDSVIDPGAITDRSRASRAPADRIGSRNGKETPLPPEGGRKRDESRFLDQVRSYVAGRLPDVDQDDAAAAVRGFVMGGARSDDDVQRELRRWRPDLAEHFVAGGRSSS